jgi:hypothetical protein
VDPDMRMVLVEDAARGILCENRFIAMPAQVQ